MHPDRLVAAILCLFVVDLPTQVWCADGTSDTNTVQLTSAASPPTNKKIKKSGLKCPAPEDIPFDFFPLPCTSNADCRLMGTGYLCCGREGKVFRCTKGTNSNKPKKSNLRITLPVVVEESVPLLTSTATSISVTKLKSTTKATTTTTTTTTTPMPTTTSTTTTTTPKPTTTTTTTTTTPKPTTTTSKPTTAATKAMDDIVCPKDQDLPFQFFVVRCVKKHSECKKSLGPDFLCCNKRCVRGITAPATEQAHQPILGLIPRECPLEPFGELLFDVQSCETDAECWPRVCCPDGPQRYCRTAMPRFDLVPATRNFNSRMCTWVIGQLDTGQPDINNWTHDNALNAVANYLQCTGPPSKAFDLFPKPCNNSLDCFPNLCCQEAGNKYCRPAKKSLLALIAGITQANRINR